MVDKVLTRINADIKIRITVKGLIAVMLIGLAVGLPQIVHLVAGASGGVRFLPMYLPVLIGGCLLGKRWGVGIGVLSPLVSFGFTSLFASSPMPALARLPFMISELAVYALVCGLFSKKIAQNSWMAFPAVIIASVSGRAVFLALVAIFQNVSTLSVELIWSQIQTGLLGLVLQAVIVPLIIMGLSLLIKKDKDDNNSL